MVFTLGQEVKMKCKCYKCRNKIMDFERTVKVHTMSGRIRLYHFSCFPRELEEAHQDRMVFTQVKTVNVVWAFLFCIIMGTIAVISSGSWLISVVFAVLSLVIFLLAPEPNFVEEEWDEIE